MGKIMVDWHVPNLIPLKLGVEARCSRVGPFDTCNALRNSPRPPPVRHPAEPSRLPFSAISPPPAGIHLPSSAPAPSRVCFHQGARPRP